MEYSNEFMHWCYHENRYKPASFMLALTTIKYAQEKKFPIEGYSHNIKWI